MNRPISVVVTKRLTTDLLIQDCVTCGIVFGVPNDFDAQRREDGAGFWCPNGHRQNYTGYASNRLETELETSCQALAKARSDLALERRHTTAAKAEAAKLRNRAIAGVCLACHRHFSNVERHVASKHPALKREQP